jgi:hypothetical protein
VRNVIRSTAAVSVIALNFGFCSLDTAHHRARLVFMFRNRISAGTEHLGFNPLP